MSIAVVEMTFFFIASCRDVVVVGCCHCS